MAPFPPRNEADESGESPLFPVPTPGGGLALSQAKGRS